MAGPLQAARPASPAQPKTMKNTILALSLMTVAGGLVALALLTGPLPGSPAASSHGPDADTLLRLIEAEESAPELGAPSVVTVSAARAATASPAHAGQREAAIAYLRGTVRARDGSGRIRGPACGRFDLVYHNDAARRRERVDVIDGRWQAPGHAADRLAVTNVILDGQPGRVVDTTVSPLSREEQVIEVRIADPARILVLERGTGRHLDEIEVCPGPLSGALPGRAPQVSLTRGASSPIDLDELVRRAPTARSVAYWVRAEGFAWNRVVIDHARGGEQTVTLEPGSTLTVIEPRGLRGTDTILRVRRPGGEPDAGESYLETRPRLGETILVAGLPHGEYEVSLTTTDRSGARVFATGTARVHTARATVQLEAGEGARAQSAELHGILTVSSAWGEVPDCLILEPVSPESGLKDRTYLPISSMRSAGTDRYLWSAGELDHGRYRARIPGTGFHSVLELDRASGAHELSVDDPGAVTVHLQTRPGSPRPQGLRLEWRIPEGSGSSHRVALSAASTRFLAPMGPLELELLDLPTGRRVAVQAVTVHADGCTAVFELDPLCELRVSLSDETGALSWDDARFWLTAADQGTGAVAQGRAGRVFLPADRTYEVRLGGMPDHVLSTPRLVRVPSGQEHRIEVFLARIPGR